MRCGKKQSGQWKDRRGSASSRGYGAAWRKIRAVALRRDLHLCQPCLKQGRTTPATAVDHIINKAAGGTDELSNLQSICEACHAEKTAAEGNDGKKKMIQIGLDGWPIDTTYGYESDGDPCI